MDVTLREQPPPVKDRHAGPPDRPNTIDDFAGIS
jgi:hypothetical protein